MYLYLLLFSKMNTSQSYIKAKYKKENTDGRVRTADPLRVKQMP